MELRETPALLDPRLDFPSIECFCVFLCTCGYQDRPVNTHANLTLQMCWCSVDSLLIVSPLWSQGETGSSGENGVPGAMVCDYRWHLKSMNSSSKWCHSSHMSSSICLFQGARGLPGERGRPGPPGPSVSVTSMHYCLCGVENKKHPSFLLYRLHIHLYGVCTQYETHFMLYILYLYI